MKPVNGGMIAPPTMATQISPEPSAARRPRPSLARLKIVGNWMAFISPMASNAAAAATPVVFAAINSRVIAPPATIASSRPGGTCRSSAAPAKRPTSAPPQ